MKSHTKKYSGVVIPMVTPALVSGKIDTAAAVRLAGSLLDAGAIPFILGTTGEGVSVPEDQSDNLVTALTDLVQGKNLVYTGISGINQESTIQTAKRFADRGASVGVVHPPYYYPLTETQLLNYFTAVADASPIPVMLYNIPPTTKISIPLEIVETLSQHSNIVGLKDSERDDNRLLEACDRWKDREDFSYFLGWGAKLVEGLLNGADGLVPSTGNIAPRLCVDLFHATLNGEAETANRYQEEHDTISRLYQGDGRTLGQSLAALKLILKAQGLGEAGMFSPLTKLEGNAEKKYCARIMEWIQSGRLNKHI